MNAKFSLFDAQILKSLIEISGFYLKKKPSRFCNNEAHSYKVIFFVPNTIYNENKIYSEFEST